MRTVGQPSQLPSASSASFRVPILVEISKLSPMVGPVRPGGYRNAGHVSSWLVFTGAAPVRSPFPETGSKSGGRHHHWAADRRIIASSVLRTG